MVFGNIYEEYEVYFLVLGIQPSHALSIDGTSQTAVGTVAYDVIAAIVWRSAVACSWFDWIDVTLLVGDASPARGLTKQIAKVTPIIGKKKTTYLYSSTDLTYSYVELRGILYFPPKKQKGCMQIRKKTNAGNNAIFPPARGVPLTCLCMYPTPLKHTCGSRSTPAVFAHTGILCRT